MGKKLVEDFLRARAGCRKELDKSKENLKEINVLLEISSNFVDDCCLTGKDLSEPMKIYEDVIRLKKNQIENVCRLLGLVICYDSMVG